MLSHDDRNRIIRDNQGLPLPAGRGGEYGSVLVDGFLGGMWRISRHRGSARLIIETHGPWTRADQESVAGEGSQLLALVAADVKDHDVIVKAAS